MNSTDPWPILKSWFPDLTEQTWQAWSNTANCLRDWNSKINLVSRKDMDRLEIKHLAHCLTITKFLRLMPKTHVLDVGTGGGLPGIPMAICYPQAKFTLMDSIAKKVMVVEDMASKLGLSNVSVRRGTSRRTTQKKTYDFVLGRAVTALPVFFGWVRDKVAKGSATRPPMVSFISKGETIGMN